MAHDLTDKTIVITGASSGIGAATALACAQAGMHCLLNGRDATRLEEVAQQVRNAGRKAVCVPGDILDDGLNARLLDAAEAELGGFYAVYANAGYGFKQPAHLLEDERLRRIFDVNFFAANDLLRQAARRLIAANRPGHLLMCSSVVAKFTMINFSAYSATKAAQNHVCRAMRLELQPFRIAVSSVHPTTTRTPFFIRSAQASGQQSADPERVFDDVPRWLLQTPAQVARAIVRCLKHPRPEVWPHTITRWAAGLITLFPRLGDIIGRRG